MRGQSRAQGCNPMTIKNITQRMRRNPPRRDGTPGNLYLRLRFAAESNKKSVTLDLPLETNNKGIAAQRARFLVRSFLRAGRRIMGSIDDIRELAAVSPRRNKKHKNEPSQQTLPLFSPRRDIDTPPSQG